MHRLAFILACLLLFPFALPSIIGAALIDNHFTTVTDLNELLAPGTHRVSMSVDGRDRRFIFVTPKSFQPGQHLPIIFFFHGAGGTSQQAYHTYGWAEKAEADHFFVVYPQGLGAHKNGDGEFHIWRDERGNLPAEINDVHFFEVILDKLEGVLPINPHRVYVTGFSNGAGMTFTLGGQFSDRIAAIAPVSSQSFSKAESLARPLPVYYITGTADPLIPYYGGVSTIATLPVAPGHNYPPVQDTVDQWARLDGCPLEPQVVSDENGVRVVRYGPGRGQSEVIFTTVEGNGHHWPGSVEPLPRAISGPALDPFNATDRIWDFFKKHPLP